jgi:hypothetical protein
MLPVLTGLQLDEHARPSPHYVHLILLEQHRGSELQHETHHIGS